MFIDIFWHSVTEGLLARNLGQKDMPCKISELKQEIAPVMRFMDFLPHALYSEPSQIITGLGEVSMLLSYLYYMGD